MRLPGPKSGVRRLAPRAQTALSLAVAALAVVALAAASRPVTAVCEQYLASHAGEAA